MTSINLSPKVIEAASTSELGILSLMVLVLGSIALAFFQKSPSWVKLTAFGMLFLGVLGFGNEVIKAQPEPLPLAECAGTEVLSPNYTTEGDGRMTKSLTCAIGRKIVVGTGRCLNTAGNKAVREEQVGSDTWVCEWPFQPIGIGISASVVCECEE